MTLSLALIFYTLSLIECCQSIKQRCQESFSSETISFSLTWISFDFTCCLLIFAAIFFTFYLSLSFLHYFRYLSPLNFLGFVLPGDLISVALFSIAFLSLFLLFIFSLFAWFVVNEKLFQEKTHKPSKWSI